MSEGPLARRARLAAQQQSGSLAERAAKAAQTRAAPAESVRLDVRAPTESTHALPFNRPDRSGDWEATLGDEGVRNVIAAAPLVAAQFVPGAEGAEALLGSLGSQFTKKPMGFRESRDALRSVTDQYHPAVKLALQAPGMLASGSAATRLPGVAGKLMRSPAMAGGVIGAADQALSADDMSLENRIMRTGTGAVAGAVAGKILDALVTGGRAIPAKTTDANVVGRETAMEGVDDALYGAAAREGVAAGGTSPKIQQALANPKIAPQVARVRGTERFKNASDAEVLTEVYRSLSRQQRALGRKIASNDDFLPDEELMRGELGDLKTILADAADEVMPTFRKAVQAHAKSSGDIEAVELGAEAMSRAGMKIKPSSAGRVGPAAYEKKFQQLPVDRRALAAEGALGNLRDYRLGLRPNAISLGGSLTSLDALVRAGPLLRRIGDPATRTLDDIIRAGLLAGASTSHPLLRGRR